MAELTAERRLDLAQEMLQKIDAGLLDIEAPFYRQNVVYNSHDYPIWGTQKPEIAQMKALHSPKITV